MGPGVWMFYFNDNHMPTERGDLHLRGAVQSDGTARLAGLINTGTDRLLAQPKEPAQASCSDIDRDGVAGLSSLVAEFSSTGTREQIEVSIVPLEADVEQRDIYRLEIRIGGESPMTVEADAAYGPADEVRGP